MSDDSQKKPGEQQRPEAEAGSDRPDAATGRAGDGPAERRNGAGDEARGQGDGREAAPEQEPAPVQGPAPVQESEPEPEPEPGSNPAPPEDAAPTAQSRGPAHTPHPAHAAHSARPPYPGPYGPPVYEPPPPPAWVQAIQPDGPVAPMRTATAWSVVATGLLTALLLGDGVGVNLVIIAIPAVLAAFFAAQTTGRHPRPWTLIWSVGAVAMLVVPALRDATWPSLLAVLGALALGSLALHGSGDTWRGALLGAVGLIGAVPSGVSWGWKGVRQRAGGSRDRWWPVVRTAAVAVALLVVFGALFAGADAAFADLLGGLIPELSVVDGPLRFLLFVVGVLGALAAARTAVAPYRWDRIETTPGRARGRVEWALPLVVLNVLFAAFNLVQLTVLFGGYDKVLSETGLSYAEYARQGFWQLLSATLLTLVVIAFALRWAPRGRQSDGALVRGVLGTLCLLTLVVVVSALRRMDLYVDAYGLTRLRLSVFGMELLLGVVIVLIMVAGVRGAVSSPGGRGAGWLPRAVLASGGVAVLSFGLLSPDGLIADQNVKRYERTGKIDLVYLQGLSADAVPALDRLPEPQRSCALREISFDLKAEDDEPWYATSYGESRARAALVDRPLRLGDGPCGRSDEYGGDSGGEHEFDEGPEPGIR
ncbi:DUF4153 domain-containing protein [Streptomyces sp. NPDC054796]